MIIEIGAALVVGLVALFMILEPLLGSGGGRRPPEFLLPDIEDTPRGMAMAALKEIEFDRETGKLSDADYQLLRDRYTQSAITAMRAEAAPDMPAEAGEVPDPVEAIISAKIRALRSASAGPGVLSCSTCGPRPEPDAVFCSNCGDRLATGVVCPACSAPLDYGARFCEACGRPQVAAVPEQAGATRR